MEFEIAYYEGAVQHVSHNAMRTATGTPGQRVPLSNDNEGILYNPQSPELEPQH